MPSGRPTGTRTRITAATATAAFESFLQGWLDREKCLLEEVSPATGGCSEQEAVAHIARVLAHFEEYYEQKSHAVHRYVFAFFAPPWCNTMECAYLWITGFRPGVLVRLASTAVGDLSLAQSQQIDRLRVETRMEEKALEDECARIQESVAAPPIMHIIRSGWQQAGELGEVNEAMETLRAALEAIVENADSLRRTTAAKVVEILRPLQSLRFLVAATRLQHNMRSWGLQRVG